MSQRTDEFVTRCHRAVIEIDDPVQLQRQLREMVEQEFPVAKPTFALGETLPMHAFLARFQRVICAGIVPDFYDREVIVVQAGAETIVVAIRSANPKAAPQTKIENPKSIEALRA